MTSEIEGGERWGARVEGRGICSRRRAAVAATAAEKDCPFDPRMHAGEDAVRTGMYICICMNTRRVREVRVARVSIRVVASSGP